MRQALPATDGSPSARNAYNPRRDIVGRRTTAGLASGDAPNHHLPAAPAFSGPVHKFPPPATLVGLKKLRTLCGAGSL